jgi:hypothetical protein
LRRGHFIILCNVNSQEEKEVFEILAHKVYEVQPANDLLEVTQNGDETEDETTQKDTFQDTSTSTITTNTILEQELSNQQIECVEKGKDDETKEEDNMETDKTIIIQLDKG